MAATRIRVSKTATTSTTPFYKLSADEKQAFVKAMLNGAVPYVPGKPSSLQAKVAVKAYVNSVPAVVATKKLKAAAVVITSPRDVQMEEPTPVPEPVPPTEPTLPTLAVEQPDPELFPAYPFPSMGEEWYDIVPKWEPSLSPPPFYPY